MDIKLIQFDDKVALNENLDIADINKIKEEDINEIKDVVNNNANELSKLNEINYIRGNLTNNQTITNSYADVLYGETYKLGTGLSLTAGEITVESENIKSLIISASLKTNDWSDTTFYLQTVKNNVVQSSNIQNTANIKFFDIVPVTKNDVIKLQCYCSSQKTFNSSDTGYNYVEILAI